MMKSLISVVVPIYKVEEFLNKCIDSIINQTYQELEIILVNDGSPDNSGLICDDYALKDKRIKVIHKKNGGLSSARNSGIMSANGKYICFIDSDDWIESNFIDILYTNITEFNADISVCGFIQQYDNKSLGENFESHKVLKNTEALAGLFDKDYIKLTVAWNKLYKIEIFSTLKYEEGIIHEDENIIHQIYFNCNKIVCINKCLYNYRIRADSITQSRFSLKHLDIVYVYENKLSFFQGKEELVFYDLTLERYFRILINIYCNLYESDLLNKENYLNEYKDKIDSILLQISKLKGMKLTNRIFLHLYKINPNLSFNLNKLINKIK